MPDGSKFARHTRYGYICVNNNSIALMYTTFDGLASKARNDKSDYINALGAGFTTGAIFKSPGAFISINM